MDQGLRVSYHHGQYILHRYNSHTSEWLGFDLETVLRTPTPILSVALTGAALLWAGVAQAQSSVAIYGIVDGGLTLANDGSTPGALLPGRSTRNTLVMKAGNTSRLGFRGREDMGGGAYARFQLEHRFASDNGAPSNANIFWLGRSVVAVGGRDWGEVYAGREYSAAYWIALESDPTYWSYVSQLGSPYTYANYTAVPAAVEASNIRWANAVGYKSPNLGGLTAELQFAAGENARSNNLSGNVQYRKGPLWIGAAFDRLDANTHLALVGAGYDFGVVRLTGSHARAKGGVNGDGKSFSLGVKVPVAGWGRVHVQAGRYNPASGRDATMFGAGTEYDLSRRTQLYFNIGNARQDSFSRTAAFDIGIKHTF